MTQKRKMLSDFAVQHHIFLCLRIVAMSPRSRQIAVASRAYRTHHQSALDAEAAMGTVMIKCPETGRDISTGIVADRESFDATPVFFSRVLCPLCGRQHEWFAQQAWVCDTEAPRPQRQSSLL